MKPQFKFGLYLVTVVGTLVCGTIFIRAWRQASAEGDVRRGSGQVSRGTVPAAAPDVAATTNSPGGGSNLLAGGGAGSVAGAPRGATKREGTNATAAIGASPENPGSATGADAVSDPAAEPSPEQEAVPGRREGASTKGLGRMITSGLLAVFSLVGLGALLAYDVSQYVAHRATQALFNDRGEDFSLTDYEKIEKVYGEGDYLEAVRMLRDFLASNPREVHAQIRIAEIYEKDLNNPLAAALEYEEVLRQPLDVQRRGWTGIHLVNLYNRLEKPDQAVALMRKICVECADTPAAAKARERLEAMGEPIPDSPAPGGSQGGAGDGGGLPPGFRRKR